LKETFYEKRLGGIKVNENWKKRHNEALMQLLGVLGIPAFVGRSRLNWIGRGNRMDIKRKVKSSIYK
jgi:hypothetical protein